MGYITWFGIESWGVSPINTLYKKLFCAWHTGRSPVIKASTEREDFSARLQVALRNASYPPDSPTQLSREFNVRFSGRPITVHAARKWLVGEAIPTQEKLRTLAQWLGVPAEWLRFGGEVDGEGNAPDPSLRFESSDVKLIADLHRLDQSHQMIAREVIRMLIRINRAR
jgi:hypothetical protein